MLSVKFIHVQLKVMYNCPGQELISLYLKLENLERLCHTINLPFWQLISSNINLLFSL